MPISRPGEVSDAGFGAVSIRIYRPLGLAFSAPAAGRSGREIKGDLALVSATSSRTPWWIALEADGAPKIIARLAVRRARRIIRRRCAGCSWCRGSPTSCHGDRSRDVDACGYPVWNAEVRTRAVWPLVGNRSRCRYTAFDGAALLVSMAAAI